MYTSLTGKEWAQGWGTLSCVKDIKTRHFTQVRILGVCEHFEEHAIGTYGRIVGSIVGSTVLQPTEKGFRLTKSMVLNWE